MAGVGQECRLGTVSRFGVVTCLGQGLLHPAPLGNVFDNPDRTFDIGSIWVQGFGHDATPKQATVSALHLVHYVHRLPAGKR